MIAELSRMSSQENTTEQLMQAGQQVETIIPHYFVYNFF